MNCAYHPRTRLDGAGECPVCEKELLEYAKLRRTGGDLRKSNLFNRATKLKRVGDL